MNKVYSRINWENEPSTKTPLNEHNLNKIDFAVDEIDNRVIELDSTKAKNTDLQTLSTRVDNLILNAGDSSAECTDARVTEDGTTYDTLKKRLDAEHSSVIEDISQLSNEIVETKDSLEGVCNATISNNSVDISSHIAFEKGSIYASNAENTANNLRCRTKDSFLLKTGDRIKTEDETVRFYLLFFDFNNNYLGKYVDWTREYLHTDNDFKCKIVVGKVDESTGEAPTVQDLVDSLFIYAVCSQPIENKKFNYNIIDSIEFELGTISQGVDADNSTRARSKGYFTLDRGDTIIAPVKKAFLLEFYNYETKAFEKQSNWYEYIEGISESMYLHTDCKKACRIVLCNTPESAFTTVNDLVNGFQINLNRFLDKETINFIYPKENSNNSKITWEAGHLSTDEGTESSFQYKMEARSNMFYVEEGTLIVPHVFMMMQVYFYDDFGNFIGTASSLGYAELSNFEQISTMFMSRANAFRMPYSSNIRIVCCPAYNKTYDESEHFGSFEKLVDSIRIVKPSEGLREDIQREIISKFDKSLECNEDRLAMTLVTDMHEYSYHNKAIVYCANLSSQYILNLGDLLSIPRTEKVETVRYLSNHVEELQKSKVPVIMSKGNHEMSKNHDYTNADWYIQCQKPFRNSDMKYNALDKMGGYFFIDNEEYNTRIICVNTFRTDDGLHGMGENQLRWICDEALNFSEKSNEENWKVLLIGHSQITNNVDRVEVVVTKEEGFLSKVLRSCVERSKSTDTTYDFAPDFTNAKFSLIGYFCGHVHYDGVRNTGYLHIATTCDHPLDDEDGYTREIGNYTEYAFDLMSFDYKENVVDCFRVGTGIDRHIHFDIIENATSVTPLKINPISWESDDVSIATVSNGIITKVSNGYCVVKAIDSDGNEEYFPIVFK